METLELLEIIGNGENSKVRSKKIKNRELREF